MSETCGCCGKKAPYVCWQCHQMNYEALHSKIQELENKINEIGYYESLKSFLELIIKKIEDEKNV